MADCGAMRRNRSTGGYVRREYRSQRESTRCMSTRLLPVCAMTGFICKNFDTAEKRGKQIGTSETEEHIWTHFIK